MYVTDTQMCLIKSLESVLGLSVLVCDALTKEKLSDCHVRYAGIDHIETYFSYYGEQTLLFNQYSTY